MSDFKCHLCEGQLFEKPLLQLNGVPPAAQYFPQEDEFAQDKGINLNIYQCSACGLVQLNTPPVDYFKEVISAGAFSPKTRQIRLSQIKEIVAKFGLQGKNVLEIGSGQGEMLDVLEEAGLKAVGIEASQGSVEAGKVLGRSMVNGYIGDTDLKTNSSFDAFVSFNYLEHLPRPGAVIRRIYDMAAPHAIGLVTVPNLEYLIDTGCFYEFVPDHLSYFTRETLTHAFQSNGFEVLECRVINEGNDITAVVKKREALNFSEKWSDVEGLIGDLKHIVGEYKARAQKVAVWGAGHRTLALLALARLKDIAYVVDSAKFKQGRSTPITHFKIVAPQHLKAEPVDLVMVMVPGIFPNEVLETLKKMDIDADIALLRENKIEIMHTMRKES